MNLNAALPRIDASRFSMVPRADIPRAKFTTQHSYRSTFNVDYLYPILAEDVLPGDVHKGRLTMVARLNDLLFPIMDNIQLETFFFFVPNRLVSSNFVKMMGERSNPADSISYITPKISSNLGGFAVGGIFDYFGLPTVGQVTAGQDVHVSALPLRMYNLIWNEWFRDQNLQNALVVNLNDTTDVELNYSLQKRNKRHDYFTSALTSPQKGTEVSIPLGGQAPITGLATSSSVVPTAGNPGTYKQTSPLPINPSGWTGHFTVNTANTMVVRVDSTAANANPLIYADLASATGATINALRLAFQTQKLLERDARGGTRYTEIVQSHFGVKPQDMRLQRPEYIGGGRTSFQTQAIPQTSNSGLTGNNRPLGSLGAQASLQDTHGFSYYATEHGWIIGLLNVTGAITYQQGLDRKWTRDTRYDYYWPAFAHLGEQAIRNDEIYCTGNNTTDIATFGYQERWAEYRHRNSKVTALFRSTSTGNIDEWHLAEQFASAPALNSTFIQQKTPIERILAGGPSVAGMQIIFDSIFTITSTRALPMNSVPGMIDRF